MAEHPFGWFTGEGDGKSPDPGPDHPLMIALRDAEHHERRGHLVAVETIVAALDGMPVDITVEAREQIKAKLTNEGWAEHFVDSLFTDPRWRSTLAAIEAAYAVAIEQVKAAARQAGKEAGHG